MDLNHIGAAAATFDQMRNFMKLTKTLISRIKSHEMLCF